MKTTIYALLALALCGCSSTTRKLGVEDQIQLLAEDYYSKPVEEVKQALWKDIRVEEERIRGNGIEHPRLGHDVYGLAMSYTRLAMIAEAQNQKELSVALFTLALRYWAEVSDLTKDSRFKISRTMAVWTIDSIEHANTPRWRKDLNYPPRFFYPKFQVDEQGEIIEKEK